MYSTMRAVYIPIESHHASRGDKRKGKRVYDMAAMGCICSCGFLPLCSRAVTLTRIRTEEFTRLIISSNLSTYYFFNDSPLRLTKLMASARAKSWRIDDRLSNVIRQDASESREFPSNSQVKAEERERDDIRLRRHSIRFNDYVHFFNYTWLKVLKNRITMRMIKCKNIQQKRMYVLISINILCILQVLRL